MKLLNFKFIRDWYRKYKIYLVMFSIILILCWLYYFFEPENGTLLFCSFLSVLYFGCSLFYIVSFSDFKDLDEDLVNYISDKIKRKKYKYFKNVGIIMFDDFFVYMTNGFKIVKYDELLWSYYVVRRGRYANTFLILYFLDGNSKYISISSTGKRIVDEFEDVLQIIKKHNSTVEIGYNKESSKKMNKILKELQK